MAGNITNKLKIMPVKMQATASLLWLLPWTAMESSCLQGIYTDKATYAYAGLLVSLSIIAFATSLSAPTFKSRLATSNSSKTSNGGADQRLEYSMTFPVATPIQCFPTKLAATAMEGPETVSSRNIRIIIQFRLTTCF